MAYSFTEKKRIRKSFAKRASVLDVPFLLATQLESLHPVPANAGSPAQRRNQGLQAAFSSIFPIVPFRQCPPRVRQLACWRTGLSTSRNASSAADLRLALRAGAPDHHGSRGAGYGQGKSRSRKFTWARFRS